MPALDSLQFHDRLGTLRPRGRYSLPDAVDLVSNAIAECRERSVNMLLVDATGMVDLAIPNLVDRFLMVEEWAKEGKGTVIVAMVAPIEYHHPRKFGVKAALHFGLICDVYTSEAEACAWLAETSSNNAQTGV